MADGERLICASGALADSGRGVRFEVEYFGAAAPAFAVRYAGAVHAYLNRCSHVAMELDWQEGAFFDLDITMANAGSVAAPLAIDFLPEGGAPVQTTNTVAANAPLQIRADQVTDGGATSTIVRSLDAVPLAIERTMSWDARGYGGHGGGAVSPATRWLFAEGAQGFLKTYILLANDNAKEVPVTVKFLLEGGVFTPDVIETWISFKRENEIDPLRLRPHPYEFALYYDV